MVHEYDQLEPVTDGRCLAELEVRKGLTGWAFGHILWAAKGWGRRPKSQELWTWPMWSLSTKEGPLLALLKLPKGIGFKEEKPLFSSGGIGGIFPYY